MWRRDSMDPINKLDPRGEFIFTAILVGAAIGAAIGAGIEAYKQSKAGKGFDAGKIVKAGLIGGAVGAVGGAIGAVGAAALGTSMAAAGAVGAISSGVEYCAEMALTGQDITLSGLATSALIGGAIGAVTAGVGGLLARRGKKAAQEISEEAVEKASKEVTEEAIEKASKEVAEEVQQEAVEKAAKGSVGRETLEEGGFLGNRKPKNSPTVRELIDDAPKQPKRTADMDMDHILDGEVKKKTINGQTQKKAVGGHYSRSPNVRIKETIGRPDANGVTRAKIQVRDPETGRWVNKRATSSMYPDHWSKRQVQSEVTGAFENSRPIGGDKWQGTSPSGVKVQGYYKKPDGSAATAWPVYGG